MGHRKDRKATFIEAPALVCDHAVQAHKRSSARLKQRAPKCAAAAAAGEGIVVASVYSDLLQRQPGSDLVSDAPATPPVHLAKPCGTRRQARQEVETPDALPAEHDDELVDLSDVRGSARGNTAIAVLQPATISTPVQRPRRQVKGARSKSAAATLAAAEAVAAGGTHGRQSATASVAVRVVNNTGAAAADVAPAFVGNEATDDPNIDGYAPATADFLDQLHARMDEQRSSRPRLDQLVRKRPPPKEPETPPEHHHHRRRQRQRTKASEEDDGVHASAATVTVSASTVIAVSDCEPPIINPRIPLWTPPQSPFSLVEELPELYNDPWKLMLACMLLNRTRGTQVRKVLAALFELCPSPEAAVAADQEALQQLITPLGLFRKRTVAVRRFSNDYINKQWSDPMELFGIGKYASDAYYMFCRGDWRRLQPEDKDLKKYHAWLVETDGQGWGLQRDGALLADG